MFSVYADGQLIYFPIEEELTIHTPKLTLEMGKAGSFQFGMPPTNRYYDSLRQLRTIITVEYDDVEIFRGRVLTINRGFNKIRDIYCEGDLAYLVDSVQKGEKYEGTTHELFRKIIQNHNSRVEETKQFVVGTIGIENRDIIIAGQDDEIKSEEDYEKDKTRKKGFDWYKQIAINGMVDEWNTSFDYIQNSIIDYCGGYLKTRRVGNTTYIDLVQDYSGTSIQKIEFGTNLIDLSEEVKAEDVYTVLIPLGDENLTISKLDDFDESRLSKVGDELRDKTAISLYGRIVKTHVFDNVNKAETLLSNARRLLDSHENMPVTFTVKAVDMHMVDESAGAIYVGDRVYVNSIPHDITQYLTCTKIEYDFDNHANDTYTFGNPKQTMTERYKKDKEKQSKSGRSRGGGGGGSAGAAAVEEAEDFAVSNSKKTADEFFDAWINVDKEAGAISLGAVYEKIQKNMLTLKNNVGIDLDAPAGTVDIYSMSKTVDTHGTAIQSSEARIQTLANDQQAQIREFTNYKTQVSEAMTSITQRTTSNESSIELLSQYDKDNKKSIASLTQITNDHESRIKSLTQFETNTTKSLSQITQNANSQAASLELMTQRVTNNETNIASITLIANNNKSQISLKADTVKMNAEILNAKDVMRAEFKSLIAKTFQSDATFSGSLQVSKFINASKEITAGTRIYAKEKIETGGNIYMNGNKLVATQEWVKSQLKNYASSTHKHQVSIGHYHKVTVSGTSYSTGGVESSANVTKRTGEPI